MEQLTLFDDRERNAPLASRLRPEHMEEYAGQKHLLGKGKILRQLIDKDQISSMIFWGPPGVGKTTLARIIANRTQASFVEFSAVTSGIKEIKEVMAQAEQNRRMGIRTLLFADEIHRFNKAQQDAFLPYVEKGSIILVGATTENPSFEIGASVQMQSICVKSTGGRRSEGTSHACAHKSERIRQHGHCHRRTSPEVYCPFCQRGCQDCAQHA